MNRIPPRIALVVGATLFVWSLSGCPDDGGSTVEADSVVDATMTADADAGLDTAELGQDELGADALEPSCSAQISSAPGLVTTSVGDIQGCQEGNGVWRFLGIPFAEPPVDDLRWRPPVKPDCLEQQPFVADAFGPKCPQLVDGAVAGEEDCLHLNVWTPAGYGPDSNLPVLFYIHGGANILGSTSDGFGTKRPPRKQSES